jgi:septum formation protein
MHSFLYLASQSPRRQELLTQLGVRFELLLPDSNENAEAIEAPLANENARNYVERVTLAKCDAALQRWAKRSLPWAPILCADTTVSLPNSDTAQILGKPADAADAERILRLLSGQTHEVLTAIALLPEQAAKPISLVQVSEVEFMELSDPLIKAYIASQEPYGKAGAYGIQGLGSAFIRRIVGSYSGIMGLPLFEMATLLQQAGVSFTLTPEIANQTQYE